MGGAEGALRASCLRRCRAEACASGPSTVRGRASQPAGGQGSPHLLEGRVLDVWPGRCEEQGQGQGQGQRCDVEASQGTPAQPLHCCAGPRPAGEASPYPARPPTQALLVPGALRRQARHLQEGWQRGCVVGRGWASRNPLPDAAGKGERLLPQASRRVIKASRRVIKASRRGRSACPYYPPAFALQLASGRAGGLASAASAAARSCGVGRRRRHYNAAANPHRKLLLGSLVGRGRLRAPSGGALGGGRGGHGSGRQALHTHARPGSWGSGRAPQAAQQGLHGRRRVAGGPPRPALWRAPTAPPMRRQRGNARAGSVAALPAPFQPRSAAPPSFGAAARLSLAAVRQVKRYWEERYQHHHMSREGRGAR